MSQGILVEMKRWRIWLCTFLVIVLMCFLQYIPPKSGLRGIILFAQQIYIIHRALDWLHKGSADEARSSDERIRTREKKTTSTEEDVFVDAPERLTPDLDEQTEDDDDAVPSREAAKNCRCPTCRHPSRKCRRLRWTEHELIAYTALVTRYSSLTTDLEDRIQKQIAEIIELRRILAETQKRYSDVVQALSTERDRARKLRKEVDYQNSPKRTAAVIRNLKHALEKQSRENDNMREARDTERRKTNGFEDEIQCLKKEIEHLRKSEEESPRKIKALEDQHDKDLAAHEALKKKFATDTSTKIEELKRQEELTNRLVDQKAAVAEEKEKLSIRVHALNEENSIITERNKKLLNSENELTNFLKTTKSEKAELMSKFDDAKHKVQVVGEKLRRIEQEHEKTRTELDIYRQKYNAKKSELQESKNRLNACEKHRENAEVFEKQTAKTIEDKDALLRDQLSIIDRLKGDLREFKISKKEQEAQVSATAVQNGSPSHSSPDDRSSQSSDNSVKVQGLLDEIRSMSVIQKPTTDNALPKAETIIAPHVTSPVVNGMSDALTSAGREEKAVTPSGKPVLSPETSSSNKLGEKQPDQLVEHSSDHANAKEAEEKPVEQISNEETTAAHPTLKAASIPTTRNEQKLNHPGDHSFENTSTAEPDVKDVPEPVFRPARWSFPSLAKSQAIPVEPEKTSKLSTKTSVESDSTLTRTPVSKIEATIESEQAPDTQSQSRSSSEDGSLNQNKQTEPRNLAPASPIASGNFFGQQPLDHVQVLVPLQTASHIDISKDASDVHSLRAGTNEQLITSLPSTNPAQIIENAQNQPQIAQTPGDLSMGEAETQATQFISNDGDIRTSSIEKSPKVPDIRDNADDIPMSDEGEGHWENVQSIIPDETLVTPAAQPMQLDEGDEGENQGSMHHNTNPDSPDSVHDTTGTFSDESNGSGVDIADILMDDNEAEATPENRDQSMEDGAAIDTQVREAGQPPSTAPFPNHSIHQPQQELPNFVPPPVSTISVPPLNTEFTFSQPVAPQQKTRSLQSTPAGTLANVIAPRWGEPGFKFGAATDAMQGHAQGRQGQDVKEPSDHALQDAEGDDKIEIDELKVMEDSHPTDAVTPANQFPSSHGNGNRVLEGKELEDEMADAMKELDVYTATGSALPVKRIKKKTKSANRMFGVKNLKPPSLPQAGPPRQTSSVAPASAPAKTQSSVGNNDTPLSPVKISNNVDEATEKAAITPDTFGLSTGSGHTPDAIQQDFADNERQDIISYLERHQALRYLIQHSNTRRKALEANNAIVPKSLKILINAAEKLESEMDFATEFAVCNYSIITGGHAESEEFVGQAKLYVYDEDYNLQSLMKEADLPEVEEIKALMRKEEMKDLEAEMWWRGMGGRRLEAS